MEPMDLTVQRIERVAGSALWQGTILACSRERLEGAPVATLSIEVRFRADTGAVSERALRRRARDEALRFLDIA
jgi:hypothetical protein